MRDIKKITKKVIGVSVAVFLFFICFSFVYADFSYQPLSPLPGTTADATTPISSLGGYITGLYKIVIGISIVLAVVLFMIAGLEWMTAEAVGKKEGAIKRINAVLFGLLLVIGSWLFLNTINPKIFDINLNITDVYINDESNPDLYGWYCKTKGHGGSTIYFGPYYSEAGCAEKTECSTAAEGSSEGLYCEEMNSLDMGFGGGTSDFSQIKITKFFDTGKLYEGSFKIYEKGPGFYFLMSKKTTTENGIEIQDIIFGPYTTNSECEASLKIEEGGAGYTILDRCNYVGLGQSDAILNMILNDELPSTQGIRKHFSDNKIKITRQRACMYIGDTECTNVGGLTVKTINSLIKLKTECDLWAKSKEKEVCGIEITAGTEWWLHDVNLKPEEDRKYVDKNRSNHRPHFFNPELGRTVDMSLSNSVFNSFIKGNSRYTLPKNNGIEYSGVVNLADSIKFLEETKNGTPDHWHVEFW